MSRLPYVLLGLLVGLAGNATLVLAWTGPSASAPGNNISAPVNVGTTAQVKNGDLGTNSFTAFGDAHLVSGWNPTPSTITYLNFSNAQYIDSTHFTNPVWGASGYGIRDNNGTLEVKNSGGSWATLANNTWTTNGTNVWNINTGNVGVGTSSPYQKLSVSGNVVADGYFHNSDERLKENIKPIAGLSIISQITGVTFDWRKDGAPSAGVIAQDVEKVLPEAVRSDPYGMKSVDYDALIAPLIEAVKEQQAEIDSLKHEIENLKRNH